MARQSDPDRRQPIIYHYSFWKQKMANTTGFPVPAVAGLLPNSLPGTSRAAGTRSPSGSTAAMVRRRLITDVDMNETTTATTPSSRHWLEAGSAPRPADLNQLAKPSRSSEAQIVNESSETGVNMPITSDFVVQLLGVVGGACPRAFINSALPQLTAPELGDLQQLGVPQDQVAEKISRAGAPACTHRAGRRPGRARQNSGHPRAIQQLLHGGQSVPWAAPAATQR